MANGSAFFAHTQQQEEADEEEEEEEEGEGRGRGGGKWNSERESSRLTNGPSGIYHKRNGVREVALVHRRFLTTRQSRN